MAKAKKKIAKKKGRTKAEITLLKVMNAAKEVNNQVLECGSAMADSCHKLDNVMWKAGQDFKFKKECWHTDWV